MAPGLFQSRRHFFEMFSHKETRRSAFFYTHCGLAYSF